MTDEGHILPGWTGGHAEFPVAAETVREVDALVIRPGDTLILRMTHNVTPAEVQSLASTVKERLADIHVLVLGGVEQMAAYKPNS